MADAETLHARFAATAGRVAELEEARRADLAERVARFVEAGGEERALDAGTGTGALAFALAPIVADVVGVDLVSELLDEGRKRASEFPNVSFVEGDVTKLPADLGEFDLSGSMRTLHHVSRPELAVAELARVTRRGGRILVVDQLAPNDPLDALDLNRFERARDPTHERTLADADFRQLFEANDLRLVRSAFHEEKREMERYLDLAGCEGDERNRALDAAPSGDSYTVTIGWYLLAR
jgi:ubiquinone/menaquinone biosynthesis C-methylase UbiE